MKEYLSVGEVAAIRGVSVKALRYYDRIGVLKPAYVNEQTGYRYYTREQLLVLDCVFLFADAGMPLKDLRKFERAEGVALREIVGRGLEKLRERIGALKATERRIGQLAEEIDNFEAHFGKGRYRRTMPEKRVVCAPFAYADDDVVNGMRINALLYADASAAGLGVGYGSGILYERRGGTTRKYNYIEVDGQVRGRLDNCRLRVFPAGEYDCEIVPLGDTGSLPDAKTVLYADCYAGVMRGDVYYFERRVPAAKKNSRK